MEERKLDVRGGDGAKGDGAKRDGGVSGGPGADGQTSSGCYHPEHGGVRQVLMSVSLAHGGGGTLELVEFEDRSFGVCRDGAPVDPVNRYGEREVERGVAAFLKTRRLLDASLDREPLPPGTPWGTASGATSA